MQTINREKLIKELESVQAGLSIRAATEQSNCFCFEDGKVRTFNDEVACEQKTDLKVKGAVIAAPLMALLRKLPEEEIDFGRKNGEILIKGKKKSSGIPFQEDIALPFKEIGEPSGKWKKLDKDFLEALAMVCECASDDQTMYIYTCVRITPKYMEAMDQWQAGRFDIETPVKKPIFIRKAAAKHLIELDITHIAEGDVWVHFKDGKGLRIACRATRDEDYPDIASFMNVKGQKARLPKTLTDATARAEVFLDSSKDDRMVSVSLEEGTITVRGQGGLGWYREVKKLSYKGPSMKFNISAKLLAQITEDYNDCLISQDRLLVESGRFKWVTSLKDE